MNFIKLWTNPASQAQAFDLETEPLNFHSPDIKQCEWPPAIQPTSHTATPTSFISPVHLLLTHCMLMMRGRRYVLLEHNPNCFLVLLLRISCYRKPWAIWIGNPYPSARAQQERDHAQRCSEAESLIADTQVSFKNEHTVQLLSAIWMKKNVWSA